MRLVSDIPAKFTLHNLKSSRVPIHKLTTIAGSVLCNRDLSSFTIRRQLHNR